MENKRTCPAITAPKYQIRKVLFDFDKDTYQYRLSQTLSLNGAIVKHEIAFCPITLKNTYLADNIANCTSLSKVDFVNKLICDCNNKLKETTGLEFVENCTRQINLDTNPDKF